jgi:hypothetical protein
MTREREWIPDHVRDDGEEWTPAFAGMTGLRLVSCLGFDIMRRARHLFLHCSIFAYQWALRAYIHVTVCRSEQTEGSRELAVS